jgi:hypothetical protein
MPPAGIQTLFGAGGQIEAWKLDEAWAVWQSSRKKAAEDQDYEGSEALYFLTLSLSNLMTSSSDLRKRRALLESTLEASFLPRHKQTMLGYLVRAATLEGDSYGAAGWLALCDRHSDDLMTDSSYRVSHAMYSGSQGDHAAVVTLLGEDMETVPIVDAFDPLAILCRADALEKSGREDAAVAHLTAVMSGMGASVRSGLEIIRKASPHWNPCPRSFPLAIAQYKTAASHSAGARAAGGAGCLYGIGRLMLLGAIGCLIGAGVCWFLTEYQGADLEEPMAPLLIAAISLLMPGLMMFKMGKGLHSAAKQAAYLIQHGKRTTATVQAAQFTGTTINHVKQYRITVSVNVEGQPPATAQMVMLLQPPEAAQFQPGVSVPVLYDPKDPTKVVLEAG